MSFSYVDISSSFTLKAHQAFIAAMEGGLQVSTHMLNYGTPVLELLIANSTLEQRYVVMNCRLVISHSELSQESSTADFTYEWHISLVDCLHMLPPQFGTVQFLWTFCTFESSSHFTARVISLMILQSFFPQCFEATQLTNKFFFFGSP